jgi:hypothetical protein
MKGLARKNTLVKYESPSKYQSKVITKVKVLLTDGQMDEHLDRRTKLLLQGSPAISRALINILRHLTKNQQLINLLANTSNKSQETYSK